MRKIIGKTTKIIKNGLSSEEYSQLSRQNKAKYNENYLLTLLDLNKEYGLTLTESSKMIKHVSKPTVLKFLERLIAKRQIYKVRRDKLIIYKPNNRPIHPLYNKTVTYGNDKKYLFQVIDNPDGLYLFIQEAIRDFFGMEEIIGGIMIPLEQIERIERIFSEVSKNKFKLIEELKQQKTIEINREYGGVV